MSEIVQIIGDITGQINLLALNATINRRAPVKLVAVSLLSLPK